MSVASGDAPHLPRSAPIEAYGNGGFRFDEMSHRGSLLCLPDSMWAWPVTTPEQIDRYALERVFERANSIDTLLIGTGNDVWLRIRNVAVAGINLPGLVLNQLLPALNVPIPLPQLPYGLRLDELRPSEAGLVVSGSADAVVFRRLAAA